MFSRVTARVVNGDEVRTIWFLFETDHETMDELHNAMMRDGSLCGTRYETERGNGNSRVVVDSYEFVITERLIMSTMPPRDDLYDSDGTLLWSIEGGEVAA